MKRLCVLGFILVSTSAMALSPAFVWEIDYDVAGYDGYSYQMGVNTSLGIGLKKITIYAGAFASGDFLMMLNAMSTETRTDEGTLKGGPILGVSYNPIGGLTLFIDFGWQWGSYGDVHYIYDGTTTAWENGKKVTKPKYKGQSQSYYKFNGPVLRTGISYLFDTDKNNYYRKFLIGPKITYEYSTEGSSVYLGLDMKLWRGKN
jgi:hypothetical protein